MAQIALQQANIFKRDLIKLFIIIELKVILRFIRNYSH